ncbi:MAG: 50S ribosomal protein L23 [Gammaproteobacteria bacterium]|nr:50S ribosomal protein L23 [Gammaproteobacteria bacterium]
MADMNQERLMNLLLSPRVTEKSTELGDKHNQYVFKVVKNATKPQIKRAVELMFKVEVASVQVSNVKGKQKSFKQAIGKRSDWKKAYVKLKPGFDIDFMGS